MEQPFAYSHAEAFLGNLVLLRNSGSARHFCRELYGLSLIIWFFCLGTHITIQYWLAETHELLLLLLLLTTHGQKAGWTRSASMLLAFHTLKVQLTEQQMKLYDDCNVNTVNGGDTENRYMGLIKLG